MTRQTHRYRFKATTIPEKWEVLFILNSLRTIVGLLREVKRLPRCSFCHKSASKGGAGTGARGATGPRGRTLREDDLVSVAAGSHIGMKGS